MRRGRWVAYCLAFLLVTSHYSLVTPSYGATLSMSATVSLSPEWKQAIRTYSQASFDTSHPRILLVSQKSLGFESIPVGDQKIQLLIFQNNKLVAEQTKNTDKKGLADFVFVAEKAGTYTALVVNKNESAPFVVKNATISL